MPEHASSTFPSCRPRLARPTTVCSRFSVPARAVPSRPLYSSASHCPRQRRAKEPELTYDLRRLRRKGLICRLERTNVYVLSSEGVRVALLTRSSTTDCSGLCSRHLPPAPLELRRALRVVDHTSTTTRRRRPSRRQRENLTGTRDFQPPRSLVRGVSTGFLHAPPSVVPQ